jgi:hypothetical protein
VRLWVAGESLRAAFEHVIAAAYRCRDDWQDRKVKDIHSGVFYPTRVASPQGTLIPLTPQESLVAKRVTTSWVVAAFNTLLKIARLFSCAVVIASS